MPVAHSRPAVGWRVADTIHCQREVRHTPLGGRAYTFCWQTCQRGSSRTASACTKQQLHECNNGSREDRARALPWQPHIAFGRQSRCPMHMWCTVVSWGCTQCRTRLPCTALSGERANTADESGSSKNPGKWHPHGTHPKDNRSMCRLPKLPQVGP